MMLDQRQLGWFRKLNEHMHDTLDDAGVRARLQANLALLRDVVGALAAQAARYGVPVDGLPTAMNPAVGLFELTPAMEIASVA
jgi:hypothetical protein